MNRPRLVLLAAFLALACPAVAQEPPTQPDRPLADVTQEARAQALFDDIRCVVCQHEAISDSPAGVASDMRRLVREEIAAGATDREVRAGLIRRYGDFVLFKPPVRGGTWLLWFGPIGAVLAVGAVFLWTSRRRRVETAPLSSEEEAKLSDMLAQDTRRRDPDANPANP